jgi:16S rRNA (guanine(966)-N(2))-methyltransferase RsmD
MKRKKTLPAKGDKARDEPIAGLRVIGGLLRGRRLAYSGDIRTRPMKDRVRESVFNLLGPQVKGTHAVDLFAGTGALGLEAISRGAARATLIERHLPTLRLIEQNVADLGVGAQVEVIFGDAFIWSQGFEPTDSPPLLIFCSPPYDFFVDRRDEMLELMNRWVTVCPPGSSIVVEADERFDFAQLPQPSAWRLRAYPPAIIGIFDVPNPSPSPHP